MSNDLKMQKGKYISLLLRHKPEAGNLEMDSHGWVYTKALLKAVAHKFKTFSMPELEEIVNTDSKQRYSFNEDKSKIRANQGHSVKVDLDFKEIVPSKNLYHGTATRFLNSIFEKGLTPQSRQWVHLTDNIQEALLTGERHGTAIVLEVNVQAMLNDGYKFYISENNRYMIKEVPAKYLQIVAMP